MSEEEKKLFEAIKYKNKCLFLVKMDADFLINLIEKQQKEIQELNILLKEKSKDIGYMVLNYINKDEIRELREIDNIDLIQFELKKLLGE